MSLSNDKTSPLPQNALSGLSPTVPHTKMSNALPASLRLRDGADQQLRLLVLRQVQRRFTVARLRVDVRSVLAEQLDQLRLIPGGGLWKRKI